MDTPFGQQAGGMHPAGILSYMAKFLLKTAWKWKKLDRGGEGLASLAPTWNRQWVVNANFFIAVKNITEHAL